MKLVYEDMDTLIDFDKQQVSIVVIENPKMMREFVQSFIAQTNGEEGKFILSDGLKTLPLSKNASIILDYFSLSLNDRKTLSKLYEILNTIAYNEDFYLKTNEINNKLQEYVSDIVYQADWHLTYEEDFKLQDVFKLLDVRFEDNTYTLQEKVLSYLELCNSFLGIKLVVFVNLNSYLQVHEIEELYNQIKYYNIKLLLLEHNLTRTSLPQEKVIVIDEDLCEI